MPISPDSSYKYRNVVPCGQLPAIRYFVKISCWQNGTVAIAYYVYGRGQLAR